MLSAVNPVLLCLVAAAMYAQPAHAACNIVNGVSYGDCAGVTVNAGTSPYKTIKGSDSISGIAEGAQVLRGGSLHVSGIADRVIVDEGGRSFVSGIVRYLEVSGVVTVTGQVDHLQLVAGGRAMVEGVLGYVSGVGTLHLSAGAVVGGEPTTSPRVVSLGQ